MDYLLDLCACGLLLIPTAYAAYCLGTPSAGSFQYGLLFLAYHTYFLAQRHGVSPGKYILNIAVVTTSGAPITVLQAVLRAGSLAMPWLLLSAGDAHWLVGLLPPLAVGAIPTAGAAWLALDALLIELTTDRRSLSDRIASTVVPPCLHRSRIERQPYPCSAATTPNSAIRPRGHHGLEEAVDGALAVPLHLPRVAAVRRFRSATLGTSHAHSPSSWPNE